MARRHVRSLDGRKEGVHFRHSIVSPTEVQRIRRDHDSAVDGASGGEQRRPFGMPTSVSQLQIHESRSEATAAATVAAPVAAPVAESSTTATTSTAANATDAAASTFDSGISGFKRRCGSAADAAAASLLSDERGFSSAAADGAGGVRDHASDHTRGPTQHVSSIRILIDDRFNGFV